MLHQMPNAFEFNSDLLDDLAFFQPLGVFIELTFDSEKYRRNYESLLSMLVFFQYYKDDYKNKNYNKKNDVFDKKHLNVRCEDIFFDIWMDMWSLNIPFNEKILFN